MLNWILRLIGVDTLTYPDHYHEVGSVESGKPCTLTLAHVESEGSKVRLVYGWDDNLSYRDADRLDSRSRAYVTCAIYDAAVHANLPCEAGPLHGRRPAWIIGGPPPISLCSAGFDVGNKICWMEIGPTTVLMSADGWTAVTAGQELVAERLAMSFERRFSRIRV